jgi:RNA polymerase sigma-70 factor, ECF subfamily
VTIRNNSENFMDDLQDIAQAIERLKRGDIGGLEILTARYQVKAVRVAFLITQDEPAAEDIVQETFIRIYQHIRYFDETRAFEPYLMRSVVHAALNACRHARKSISLDEDPDEIESLLSRAASPEAIIESSQYSQEILAALSRLSPRQRAVIVQRYYLEMSEQEMSQALKAAPGTIKWLLNAARTRLRDLLRPERSIE